MTPLNHQEPAVASAAVTEADLRRALNVIVRDSLPLLATVLGLQYLAFAVKHALSQPTPVDRLMSLASGTGAAVAFGFRLALRRWSIPEGWAQPVVAMMAGLLLCTNFLHLYFVSEPHQTANLLVITIGAGVVFLSAPWLALVIVATLSGWAAIVSMSPPSAVRSYYTFALLGAALLAIMVHTVRVRTFCRIEKLRLENERQKEQLQLYATQLEKTVEARTNRVRELENQRVESEKLAAIGRMAARIAHEINNPLGAIKTAFSLLGPAVPKEHQYHHYLGKIEKEIDRIARIVRQMLDLYKPDTASPKEFRVDQIIGEVLTLLRPACHEREIEFDLDVAPAQGKITLPEGMLRQILYHLVLNAVEASPNNGIVHITVRVAENRLRLAVLDHGNGIPGEIKSRIFEPLFTTKRASTAGSPGMGLAVCKTLVEAMNGAIEFDTQFGRGTEFRISLPLNGIQTEP